MCSNGPVNGRLVKKCSEHSWGNDPMVGRNFDGESRPKRRWFSTDVGAQNWPESLFKPDRSGDRNAIASLHPRNRIQKDAAFSSYFQVYRRIVFSGNSPGDYGGPICSERI